MIRARTTWRAARNTPTSFRWPTSCRDWGFGGDEGTLIREGLRFKSHRINRDGNTFRSILPARQLTTPQVGEQAPRVLQVFHAGTRRT